MNELRGVWPTWIGIIFVISTIVILSIALALYYRNLFRRMHEDSVEHQSESSGAA